MLHYLYLLNAFPVLLLQVRDGGGVDVDVKVEGAKLPAVEALLITQDAFFGFATRWTRVRAFSCIVSIKMYGLNPGHDQFSFG